MKLYIILELPFATLCMKTGYSNYIEIVLVPRILNENYKAKGVVDISPSGD